MAEEINIDTIKLGDGRTFAKKGQTVRCRYTGQFTNGIQFDTNQILEFQLGSNEVILGWEEIIPKISLGQKIMATIPPSKAYGKEGLSELIPQNATLIFEIEILAIK